MTQPAPHHIPVNADQLQTLMEDAQRVAARAARLLDQAGIDITGATPPIPAGGNVVSLADFRARRAVTA
jgi:hypothetical protein